MSWLMRLCRPALYCIVLVWFLLLYCFSRDVILRSHSSRGCQWRFDWQNHSQDSTNGCRVRHLVVMRMSTREGAGSGFISTPAVQRNRYIRPKASLCFPSTSRRRGGRDSGAHTHSRAPVLLFTATKWEGEKKGGRGGTSEERRQSSQTFQGPPFPSNEA